MPTALAKVPEKASQSVVTTQRALAEQLGFSATQIGRWIREPGFPRVVHSDGSQAFIVADVLRWLAARKKKPSSASGRRGRPAGGPVLGPRPGSPAAIAAGAEPDGAERVAAFAEFEDLEGRHYRAKVKKEEADAQLKRLKADVLDGRYVETSVYERDMTSLAAVFRKLLSEQPDRVRADYGDEAAELAQVIIDRVWVELDQVRATALQEQGVESDGFA